MAVKIFKQRVTNEEFSKEVIMLRYQSKKLMSCAFALTVRNLNHDNIVKFIGYVNFEVQNGIVMEFMERYIQKKKEFKVNLIELGELCLMYYTRDCTNSLG